MNSYRLKKLKEIEELERIDEMNNPIILKDLDDGDWSSYKKNRNRIIIGDIIGKKRKKIYNVSLINDNINMLFKLQKKLLEYKNINKRVLISNLEYYKVEYFKLFLKNKNTANYFFKYYLETNFNFYKKIKNCEFLKNFLKKIIFIIDIRRMKPKLFIINENRCVFSMSSGIIYKKMQMKKKKNKRTQKMLNLMIKSTVVFIKNNRWNNIVIHLKGTKSNISNLMLFIKNNFNKEKLFFIYSPHIKENSKFKKVKAIKRKLKKKIIRFK